MSNTYIPINMRVDRIAVEDPDKTLRTFDLSFVNEADAERCLQI